MGSDVAGACGQLLKKKRGAVDIEDAAGGAPRRAGGRRAPSPRRGARRRRRRRRRRARARERTAAALALVSVGHAVAAAATARLWAANLVVVCPVVERQTRGGVSVGKQPRQRAPGIGDEVRRHAQRRARPDPGSSYLKPRSVSSTAVASPRAPVRSANALSAHASIAQSEKSTSTP